MASGLTKSEIFVNSLCERAFLKLWTHPNPVGKNGKELCDCLVVCAEHIIIISVKEIEYKDTGNRTGADRWHKSAIKKSIDQIIGAERWLQATDNITRNDGRVICLPPRGKRKYFRISVSLGSKREIPVFWSESQQKPIHVLDEFSTEVVFGAYDTINDFIDFLGGIEKLLNNTSVIFDGGGYEDLAALYLTHKLDFETDKLDTLIVANDLWRNVSETKEFQSRQLDFKTSYIWDRLIEYYANDLLTDGMFDMHSKEITKNEQALIAMTLQPRGHRANLADAFIEFLTKAELKIASRAVIGHNNTAFVFLIGSSSDREYRIQELTLRCLVIRQKFSSVTTVVGIATDRAGTSNIGYSSDIVYMHLPELTEEHKKEIYEIQNKLGYFN